MFKHGFVYIWFDRKHKRFYIGCRWGCEDDGYICSSKWMKDSYKRRPEDFKRRILKTNIVSKKETLDEEYIWLKMIRSEELGNRYYNLHNHHYGHWSTNLNQETIIEKMSKAKKGKPSNRKGCILLDVSKEKLRQANLGKKQSLETIDKRVKSIKSNGGPWNKGQKGLQVAWNKGKRMHEEIEGYVHHFQDKFLSDEHKQKLKDNHKSKKT